MLKDEETSIDDFFISNLSLTINSRTVPSVVLCWLWRRTFPEPWFSEWTTLCLCCTEWLASTLKRGVFRYQSVMVMIKRQALIQKKKKEKKKFEERCNDCLTDRLQGTFNCWLVEAFNTTNVMNCNEWKIWADDEEQLKGHPFKKSIWFLLFINSPLNVHLFSFNNKLRIKMIS